MSRTLLLQVLAAILTILIAIVPLWYPRYSCYRKQAERGIEKLGSINIDAIKETGDDQINRRETLTPDDTGFREVSRAIENNTSVVREPAKILLTVEGTFATNISMGPSSDLQAKNLVEYEDGTQDTVVDSPAVEIQRVTNLTEVRRWVKNEANHRSHYWTTIFALAWGTVSLFIIFGI